MVNEAWSGIDVQLQKRHDLIPNIVKVVQGYASHEKTCLKASLNYAPKVSMPIM